jgi:hypothetical protein
MAETSSWLKDYVPLAAALVVAVAGFGTAIFQYVVSKSKTNLEMEKLRKEINKLSDDSKSISDNISKIQNVMEQLPMYSDETIIYNNTSGNLGFDFTGRGGQIWDGNTPVTGEGSGKLTFPGKGIINVERYNTDGRYELYLKKYTIAGKSSDVISKDTIEDKPRRFRVACEARTINGEHTLRFVIRDREKKDWIGESVTHRITSQEWNRCEARFTVPPLVEAELRVDDEGVLTAPSTIQIRKLMMTQRISE